MASPTSSTFAIVGIVWALLALTPRAATGLEAFPELVRLLTNITESSQVLTDDPRIDLLMDFITDNKLEHATVEFLLYPKEEVSGSINGQALAIIIWSKSYDTLRNRDDLYLQFLKLKRHRTPDLIEMEKFVTNTLSNSSLLPSEDGPKESLLERCIQYCSWNNLHMCTVLAQRTPGDIVGLVSRRALDLLEPRVWARVFQHHNQEKIALLGDFNAYCDATFGHRPDRHRFAVQVVMTSLDYFGNNLLEPLSNLRLDVFLMQCRGSVSNELYDEELELMHLFAEACFSLGFSESFLDMIPLMVSSRKVSRQLLEYFLSTIDYDTNSFDQVSFLVARRILNFHSNHDPTVIYWLVSESDRKFRVLDFISILTRSILSDDSALELSSPDTVINKALETCHMVLHDSARDHQTAKVLLSLVLVYAARHEQWHLLDSQPVLNEDLLRHALVPSAFHDGIRIPQRWSNAARRLDLEVFDQHSNTESRPVYGNSQIDIRHVADIEQEYEILEPIGRNPSSVYRARSLSNNEERFVAIKVQDRNDTNAKIELDFVSRYCHSNQIPGLVSVTELVQYAGRVYIVMELIPGYSLQHWLSTSSATKTPEHLIWITYQALSTLDRLRDIGWMHGDQSDFNNWMIDEGTGRLVLTGFGRASPRSLYSPGLDREEFYDGLLNLIDDFKQFLNLSWYEAGPAPLQQLEQSVINWPYWNLTCADLLSDPVFDSVRSEVQLNVALGIASFPMQDEPSLLSPLPDCAEPSQIDHVADDPDLLEIQPHADVWHGDNEEGPSNSDEVSEHAPPTDSDVAPSDAASNVDDAVTDELQQAETLQLTSGRDFHDVLTAGLIAFCSAAVICAIPACIYFRHRRIQRLRTTSSNLM